MRISPPALTVICLCGILLHGWASPVLKFTFSGQIYFAIFLVAVGFFIGLTALRRFYQVDTTVLPQEMDSSSALVTGGILKIT